MEMPNCTRLKLALYPIYFRKNKGMLLLEFNKIIEEKPGKVGHVQGTLCRGSPNSSKGHFYQLKGDNINSILFESCYKCIETERL